MLHRQSENMGHDGFCYVFLVVGEDASRLQWAGWKVVQQQGTPEGAWFPLDACNMIGGLCDLGLSHSGPCVKLQIGVLK